MSTTVCENTRHVSPHESTTLIPLVLNWLVVQSTSQNLRFYKYKACHQTGIVTQKYLLFNLRYLLNKTKGTLVQNAA